MLDDTVVICVILRNFKSDSEHLLFEEGDRNNPFGHFWIQGISEEDKRSMCDDLKMFGMHWADNYYAARWYYIGKGKSTTVLRDNMLMFFYPLFRTMKLYRTGDLVYTIGFYKWKEKWHEGRIHSGNYGIGYGLKGNTYVFNKNDITQFIQFKQLLEPYLRYVSFSEIPYLKKHESLKDIDIRCLFALHILLKGTAENSDPYILFDKVIDYTMGLESLYLLKEEWHRGRRLSRRISYLLGKDDNDENRLSELVMRFHEIRNDIVHASLVGREDADFLSENIYVYEDILRQSILAFFDLNLKIPTKEEVLNKIDASNTILRASSY